MSSPPSPLVSIVIPSYNQGRFLRATIESCLQQDYRPLEIVVVDGASKDDSVAILREFSDHPEVRWISEPDSGVADAVNKGFRMARGEICGIQSSDDFYLPGAVAEAVATLQQHPDAGLVYSHWIYTNADDTEKRPLRTAPYTLENFLSGATVITQNTAFFRLPLALELGGWNPEYFTCDTELWLRMLFRTNAFRFDGFWGVRRLHEEQRNTQAAKIVESYRRMMTESPDLKKAPPHLRKAAACGVALLTAGYNPKGSRSAAYLNYWKAYLSYPEIGSTTNMLQNIIPCYWTLRKWKRRLAGVMTRLRG
jgi:glycosyltransferase involved in cell wall biosynthesis